MKKRSYYSNIEKVVIFQILKKYRLRKFLVKYPAEIGLQVGYGEYGVKLITAVLLKQYRYKGS